MVIFLFSLMIGLQGIKATESVKDTITQEDEELFPQIQFQGKPVRLCRNKGILESRATELSKEELLFPNGSKFQEQVTESLNVGLSMNPSDLKDVLFSGENYQWLSVDGIRVSYYQWLYNLSIHGQDLNKLSGFFDIQQCPDFIMPELYNLNQGAVYMYSRMNNQQVYLREMILENIYQTIVKAHNAGFKSYAAIVRNDWHLNAGHFQTLYVDIHQSTQWSIYMINPGKIGDDEGYEVDLMRQYFNIKGITIQNCRYIGSDVQILAASCGTWAILLARACLHYGYPLGVNYIQRYSSAFRNRVEEAFGKSLCRVFKELKNDNIDSYDIFKDKIFFHRGSTYDATKTAELIPGFYFELQDNAQFYPEFQPLFERFHTSEKVLHHLGVCFSNLPPDQMGFLNVMMQSYLEELDRRPNLGGLGQVTQEDITAFCQEFQIAEKKVRGMTLEGFIKKIKDDSDFSMHFLMNNISAAKVYYAILQDPSFKKVIVPQLMQPIDQLTPSQIMLQEQRLPLHESFASASASIEPTSEEITAFCVEFQSMKKKRSEITLDGFIDKIDKDPNMQYFFDNELAVRVYYEMRINPSFKEQVNRYLEEFLLNPEVGSVQQQRSAAVAPEQSSDLIHEEITIFCEEFQKHKKTANFKLEDFIKKVNDDEELAIQLLSNAVVYKVYDRIVSDPQFKEHMKFSLGE